MFQFTDKEWENLKSQNVMSSEHGGRRTLPFAFTEQAAAMLFAVLRNNVNLSLK